MPPTRRRPESSRAETFDAEGVEHKRRTLLWSGRQVQKPLMPKGVEHKT